MSNANDARRAHDLLDQIDSLTILSKEQEKLLRSFLPPLPKQKTLEELTKHVYDAWAVTNGHEWPDDIHGELETWLDELHEQLKGLKDTPIAVPALPAGMRIAVHAVYGRVVVSPVVDDDGTCKIFHLSTHARDGSDYCWAPIDSLTFIDYEPAESTHPPYLETEQDYENAPEGTIVAVNGSKIPTIKDDGWPVHMAVMRRRILRWGLGE